MALVVDGYRKVTISLGGRCPLACRHCYTTARQFRHDADTTAAEVLTELGRLTERFDIICVSGDTDCFLDPDAGLELIAGAAHRFPHADLMFTSRLVPDDSVVLELSKLAAEMAAGHRLLLPGISLVSMQVPNFSERSRRIPSAESRLDFLAKLAAGGMACLLALRPTFPFALVRANEVRTMISLAAESAAAVLGEIMLLDEPGQLAGRLGLDPVEPSDRSGNLTFLDQPGTWRKRTLPGEVSFAARACDEYGVAYFLRSGMALAHIRQHWDWQQSAIRRHASSRASSLLTVPDP